MKSPRVLGRAPRQREVAALIALCMALAGCSTTAKVGDDPAMPRAGNAFLVRGLFDVFSLGLNDMKGKLRAEGVNAHTVSGLQRGDLACTIAAARRDGRLSEPIVLIGHSYGADDAIRVARSLHRENIAIDALVLIDPTTPPEVPANVRRCFNIYKSSPATDWIPVLRGVAVHAEGDSTDLTNLDLRTCAAAGEFRGVNHFDIEEVAAIHAMIVREVLKHCPYRAGQATSLAPPSQRVVSTGRAAGAMPADAALGALGGRECDRE